jgi:6-phosphogluconolactonase
MAMNPAAAAKVVPGELVTEADPAGVAREAAARMAGVLRAALEARGKASIALSGGNTPRDAYATLAGEPGLDWTKVDIFWVDERAVGPTDDRSNYRWAKVTLLDAAGVPPERVHRMPSDAPDLDLAAKAYDSAIASLTTDHTPAFDLVVLGVGDDGHTASLFPGDPTVDVTDRLVAAVPARPGREARLTLTRTVIQQARQVLVLVVGAGKQRALSLAWAREGDVHQTPSRIIRDCKGVVTWIVDEAARGPA